MPSKMVDRPHDYLSALGARIAITRNELGMSQAKVSAALGISLRAYQSYELGKRSIPVEALVELHRQFAVDLNWILLGVEAVRLEHDLTALEEFEVALDTISCRGADQRGVRATPDPWSACKARSCCAS